ncbi:cytosine permease [Metabacillus sp. KIGAM252]|uniref:Cytosine permease n=1 Tax=Metabacillus flavus TaxID=2823519 RepID=A0ABS5LGZ6_9BACI|nr:cytosine permease [Metabacillus flavus]MBS2970001.1 cytosine permease [Metabacillus flavus]
MIPIEKKPVPRLERFGLEAVPQELRKTGWVEYFIIQFAFSFNAGNVLLPALAVMDGGLSFSQAFFSCAAGAFLAFLLVSFLSLPGSVSGLPAQYAIRSILGSRVGQYAASPIRSLISLYWFSVQTIGGTWMLIESLKRFGVQSVSFPLLAAGLGAIMIGITIVGFHAVKKAAAYFLPFLLAGEGIILYLYFTTNTSLTASVSTQTADGADSLRMLLFASLVFVQYVAGVSASADMTRYARSPLHGFWGMFAGNFIGFLMTAFLGIFSAFYFAEINPFLSASRLTESSLLFFIILAASILSLISINLSNAYTGSFSLLNIFPSLGRIKSAVLFGTAGIILSTMPAVVTEAKNWITILGSLSIPLSAVIVSDFLFVKKRTISDTDLLHMGNVNRQAVFSMAAGILIYWVIPSAAGPGFISFIATCVIYILIIQKKAGSN